MKKNQKISADNTILVLVGVVKHLNDQIDTKRVLVKHRLTSGLEELYTKQIISAIAKVEYLEVLISELREDLELTTNLEQKETEEVDNAILSLNSIFDELLTPAMKNAIKTQTI